MHPAQSILSSLQRIKILSLLVQDKSCFANGTKWYFIDIGIPEDYAKAQEVFADKSVIN